jgi:hypothetical protein
VALRMWIGCAKMTDISLKHCVLGVVCSHGKGGLWPFSLLFRISQLVDRKDE